jgi:hypothetical protein
MTGRQFDLVLLGLTRPTAARALGLSPRSITRYANSRSVPPHIKLAVKGLLAERQTAAEKSQRTA